MRAPLRPRKPWFPDELFETWWSYLLITGKADKKDMYEIHIDRNAWIAALYLQNPAHKERLSRIEDDRMRVGS